MNCPIDDTQLAITERQGVEIDYCPQCRGVWLDRGELDKIIDKTEDDSRKSSVPAREDPRPYFESEQSRHYDDHHYKKKRRESFLGDLFDF